MHFLPRLLLTAFILLLSYIDYGQDGTKGNPVGPAAGFWQGSGWVWLIALFFIVLFIGCQWRNAWRRQRKQQFNAAVDHQVKPLREEVEDFAMANIRLEEANLFKSKLLHAYYHHMGICSGAVAVVATNLLNKWESLTDQQKLDDLNNIYRAARQDELLGLLLQQWSEVERRMPGDRSDWQPQLISVAVGDAGQKLADVLDWKHNRLVNRTGYVSVPGDVKLINYLVFNLVAGANRVMSNGDIIISAEDSGSGPVVIEVRDTGNGPEALEMRQLLEKGLAPGNSLHRTMQPWRWQIGYLCLYDLLHLMEGTMQVSENETGGTTIRVELPRD